MSTEITTTGQQTALVIDPQQTGFTDMQVSALRHIGVEDASPGDLAVFFHVTKRTGLDPFARQIYMISRRSKDRQGNWVTKQTIQTGIDGYRLIGRRAADQAGETISVSAPEWCRSDGEWMWVWSSEWGLPLAARVTIERAGQPFTAVAMFDEYKQTTRTGDLNTMWSQRPAGQISKCAEALAWRMAFPQDLAGVYVEDEMQHADIEPPAPRRRETAAQVIATTSYDAAPPAATSSVQASDEVSDDAAEPEPITDHTRKRVFALLRDLGITDAAQQRAGMSQVLGRKIATRTELTEDDGRALVIDLEARKAAAATDAGEADRG